MNNMGDAKVQTRCCASEGCPLQDKHISYESVSGSQLWNLFASQAETLVSSHVEDVPSRLSPSQLAILNLLTDP